MEGSAAEDLGAPESWELADLDETMGRLMLNDSRKDDTIKQQQHQELSDLSPGSGSSSALGASEKVSEDVINQVDQFLHDALRNPRERLSVLRMEQDIENFIRDPTQQQFEFQQLPTSYLRLAAHRVAQHYSLQSMVLMDSNLPDGSGSRIIVRKTSSQCRLPSIRLADVPVNLPSEESGVLKVAIKQRPQKKSHILDNSNSSKTSTSKSVEERKEEYNKARARIFSSGSINGGSSGKPEGESRLQDGSQHVPLGISKIEERPASGISDVNAGRGLIEYSTSSSRSARSRLDKEVNNGRGRPNSRVAIFRDREVDRKDPDYDRSYERYMQRFDPGFGFNGGGPYTIQPMYAPALNYNTEFPQLGPSHRPQLSAEQLVRPLPQHLSAPWAAPTSPAGIGFGHPETMMSSFSPNHVSGRSSSAIYLHSPQYPCQRPVVPFFRPHEHVPPFSQSHQQQPDASFGLAWPR